jgi:hypothetical protein
MKFTHTGRPRRVARSTVPPPTCGMRSAGAVCPTWKLALTPLPAALPLGLGGTDREGDGEAVAGGALDLAGGVGAGSGARTTIATTISAAAATPDSSPATIGWRERIGARVPVRATTGGWSEPLVGCRAMPILDLIRARVLPALLTAAGVTLVVAGLLSYTNPAEAGPGGSPTPSLPPSAAATATAVPTPTATPEGSPSPSVPADRLATRVQIPALRVDLPVIKQPDPAYPSCNVAMYHEAFGPPGDPRGTYIYAHARKGMFLALLDASKKDNGAAMVGRIVNVYTSDDQLFLYQIVEVRRHVPASFNLTKLYDEGTFLWLQTSEGPNHTYPKLMLKARLLSSGPADHAAAHPAPHPVNCA